MNRSIRQHEKDRMKDTLFSFFLSKQDVMSHSAEHLFYTEPKEFPIVDSDDERFFAEALEAKKAFENGDVAAYEEVFGHPQPGF